MSMLLNLVEEEKELYVDNTWIILPVKSMIYTFKNKSILKTN